MASSAPQLEHELVSGPSDGVSRVAFSRRADSDHCLVTSWDKCVRVYDGRRNVLSICIDSGAPILDGAFDHHDDNKAFTGGLDNQLSMWDVGRGTRALIGSHEDGVRCVLSHGDTNTVVTGSWDGSICMWDSRVANTAVSASSSSSSSSSSKCLVARQVHDGSKVLAMDANDRRLVVGLNNRHVYIYDIRNMSQVEQHRESSLANQTRQIKCSPDGQGYALSSIEGRIAIEFFDPSPSVQSRKYAFKCHRKTEGSKQILYPVNAIAYHKYGTFASGGCDGFVFIWDGESKKRICQYPQYATSIASLDFNHKGDLLAIAASYTYEQGDKPHPRDSVFIRSINDSEVMPKRKV